MRRWLVVLLASLASAAPSCDEGGPSEGDADADGDTDADGGADGDADGDEASDGDPDGAEDADTLPWDPRFDGLAATIDAERIALGAPGAAFAVIEGGEVVFAAGFGSRDPDDPDQPVAATTLFRIGSVTKMLTAMALLQLVDAGLVDLDRPVTDVVPELTFALDPTWADTILVRHLLEQSSGLVDTLSIDGPDDALLESGNLAYASEGYLMAPSGRLWNYSNPNFALAGWLVERASGEGYRARMAESLLGPLGMDRTLFLGSEVLADGDYASGLTTDWETGVGRAVARPDSYDSGWMRPAGFAWSSVLDLAEVVRFLAEGDAAVLPEALHDELARAQISTEVMRDYQGYGFGLFVSSVFNIGPRWYETPLVYHGGDIMGFAADVYCLPELDAGVVALASTDLAHFGESVAEAFELLDGLPEPGRAPADLAFDPSSLPELAGTYRDDFGLGLAIVTAEGGTLAVSMPDLDAAGVPYGRHLSVYGPDNFLAEIDGSQWLLTFIRDEAGRPEYVRSRAAVFHAVTDPGKPPPSADPAAIRRALERGRRAGPRLPSLPLGR